MEDRVVFTDKGVKNEAEEATLGGESRGDNTRKCWDSVFSSDAQPAGRHGWPEGLEKSEEREETSPYDSCAVDAKTKVVCYEKESPSFVGIRGGSMMEGGIAKKLGYKAY
ncbi:unnamed protein product [Tuber aestivum]|uniref:Uncharacterized protein n=1 Tax=Tuber aestivum TaxID=59557 RepID=A0A292PV23_9PEZI|nr:unnamed protein product [Tuber aestivum]